MIFLLDTNAFSDLMREHPKTRARLASIAAPARVVICTIVRGEIKYGSARLPFGQRQQDLESKAARLFASLTCEPVPEAAGDYYATVKLIRLKKSLGLGESDQWIAATALALDATLVSRDAAFQQVDGLMVEDWTL
jgi:tRNA(fMet)-specific endonuclease VapC